MAHENADLVGSEVTDGTIRLRCFQLFQTPLQIFERLHSQLLTLFICTRRISPHTSCETVAAVPSADEVIQCKICVKFAIREL